MNLYALTDQQINDLYRDAVAEGLTEDAALYANEAARRGMIL